MVLTKHTPQGIELYPSKAILYSTGDFVDDYAVDPDERNDLSFLFCIEVDHGRIQRIILHPTAIETSHEPEDRSAEVRAVERPYTDEGLR